MRGDIYRLKSSKTAKGHEQKGARYGVVVQSDSLPLSTVLVAPTSTSCTPTSFRPLIDIKGVETRVLVEQIAAVDAEVRLGEIVDHLTLAELQAVQDAILIVMGLD